MSAAEQPPQSNSQSLPWRFILQCFTVFAAAFVLFGLIWPAMSPGIRASICLDFCLPETSVELSDYETDMLKSVIANEVSAQLTGNDFDSLIQQTQRTGKVFSAAIEYFDREAIAENIELGFAMGSGHGQLQIDYVCQGNPDQLRFLQLLGQRLANSIENLELSPENEITASNGINGEKFDRAIWLANQIQSDLDQIRGEPNGTSNYNQTQNGRTSPYAFASTTHRATRHSSQQQPITDDALNSIDASSLTGLLTEIKSETATPGTNATFGVLKVDPVRVRSINATPDRWAMVGLLTMASMVSVFYALYQHVPAKPSTSVETLSQSLGIPVVAVLSAEQNSQANLSSVEFFSNVATALYVAAKIFLIVFTIVVLGFVLIDSSIRESFFQNPFDGVAKIFRVFFGYA